MHATVRGWAPSCRPPPAPPPATPLSCSCSSRPCRAARSHRHAACFSAAKPRIAITVGDPAGIGTETVLKALADPSVAAVADISVVCTPALLKSCHAMLGSRPRRQHASGPAAAPLADPGSLTLHAVSLEPEVRDAIIPGMGTAASGEASFKYLDAAISQALAGEVDAIVTGPIAKASWHQAGHCYPGQTELLAERAGVQEYAMMFVATSPTSGWQLRCLLATTHIPLSEVPRVVSASLLQRKLDLLIRSLQQDFGLDPGRLHVAVAGLNPHSGEGGQLGTEETEWLTPWLQQEQARHPLRLLEGPVPPDTLWVRPGQAWFGPPGGWKGLGVADAYIAQYHDQGLIPVKLMAFDHAVNVTLGLPFVRTSPDHGTAFGIADLGIADSRSMQAAIVTAAEMVQQRKGRGAATQQQQQQQQSLSSRDAAVAH